MSDPSHPSKFARIQTWLALGLLLLMLALGIAWYGFSIEVHPASGTTSPAASKGR